MEVIQREDLINKQLKIMIKINNRKLIDQNRILTSKIQQLQSIKTHLIELIVWLRVSMMD